MQHLKVIVFDWDGTLMDSEAAIVAAMSEAYRDERIPAPPYGTIRAIIGLGLTEGISLLTPELSNESIARVEENYRRQYIAQRSVPLLFPRVRSTLIELRQSGYFLAVATGKSASGLQRAIDQTELDDLFVTTRTADLTEPKPSPTMLYEIMRELDAEPQETLMIGDTEYDLAMAQSAGTHRAGVSYGTHSVGRLLPYDPAFVLDHFGDLPSKLRNRTQA